MRSKRLSVCYERESQTERGRDRERERENMKERTCKKVSPSVDLADDIEVLLNL